MCGLLRLVTQGGGLLDAVDQLDECRDGFGDVGGRVFRPGQRFLRSGQRELVRVFKLADTRLYLGGILGCSL